MARMNERKARNLALRFLDPRLNRVGFGIEITLYNPKERIILIYRKRGIRSETPSLSVLPSDETQRLAIDQLCAVARGVIREVLRNGYLREAGCICSLQVHLLRLEREIAKVSIYHIIDRLNRLVEFLYTKMSWQEVKDIVWSPIPNNMN